MENPIGRKALLVWLSAPGERLHHARGCPGFESAPDRGVGKRHEMTKRHLRERDGQTRVRMVS